MICATHSLPVVDEDLNMCETCIAEHDAHIVELTRAAAMVVGDWASDYDKAVAQLIVIDGYSFERASALCAHLK